MFDKNVLITANKAVRIKRAVSRNNLPLESIQNRISLQMSDVKKKKIANHTIANSNSIENFYKKIDEFYDKIKF